MPGKRGLNREFKQRNSPIDQRLHSLRPTSNAQLTRIHAVGLNCDERLRSKPLILSKCTQRRLLPCCVSIEGEHHMAGKGVVIHQEAAQDLDVVGAE